MFRVAVVCQLLASALTASAALLSSLAATAGEPLGVNSGSFKEKFDRHVNVSGQIRAGFMRVSETGELDLDELWVHFHQQSGSPGDTLCFSLTSRDGIYSAKWDYTLKELRKASAQARIDSARKDDLQSYKVDTLVALATIGISCRDKKRVYLPTSWGNVENHGANDPGPRYTIYLNADATKTRLKVETIGSARKTDCEKIPDSADAVAFDTVCQFQTVPGDNIRRILVARDNFGTHLPSVKFHVSQQ